MWIFGYGSLVWKTEFPYTKKVIGFIKGYERKFWQASIDHRGVAEKPGRVVTIIPSDNPEAKVFGAAYKIEEKDEENVMNQLDLREIMGYEKKNVQFYPDLDHKLNITNLDNKSGQNLDNISKNGPNDVDKNLEFPVTIYYGSPDSEHFAGKSSVEEIAQIIQDSCGPSGPNSEYFHRLYESMGQISDEALDQHLRQIKEALDNIDKLK